MRLRVLLALLASALLTSCLGLDDTETGSVSASCVTTGFTSHIVFIVEAEGGLPPVLSGRINDTVSFDECNGSERYLYTIDRSSTNYATVSIWLPDTAKVYDEYFNKNGEPVPNADLSYKIFGRPYCDADEIIMSSGTSSLSWQPLYTSNATCPSAGYSAIVR